MAGYVVVLLVILRAILGHELPASTTLLPTDMRNTSIKTIIERLGLVYQSYDVITDDGYILNLNRMIHRKKIKERDKGVPVLFVNGYQMYSDTWLLQSKPELNVPVAYLLRGYDIWLGDQRGALRSRRHINMTDDVYEFWDFSFHETGVYDLPAFIDFILNATKHKKLVYSGLSMGSTFYYVMCSEKPEYQDKLYGSIQFVPLGEAPRMTDMTMGALISTTLFDSQLHVLKALRIGPSLPNIQRTKLLVNYSCKVSSFAFMSFLTGFSIGYGCKFDKKRFCTQMASCLGGSSARTGIHMFQLFRNGGRLTKYDWGPVENLKRYGTSRPPEYDVSKIRIFTASYFSDIDEYAPTKTVVPFTRKFRGPTYECEIPGVCHIFAAYDSRAKVYVEDSADVLDSMTGRANSTKMLSKTCKIDFAGTQMSLIGRTEEFLVELLPNFMIEFLP